MWDYLCITKIISGLILCLAISIALSCKDHAHEEEPEFSVMEILIPEGSSVHSQVITVVSSVPIHNDVPVNFSLQEGNARFTDDLTSKSGQLDFSANKTEATFSVEIVGDEHPELHESFTLVISYHSQEYAIPVIIEDDDPILVDQIQNDADGFKTPFEYPSMQLVWSDEFNETALNTDFWSYEIGNGCSAGICGWGNNELQSYTNASGNIATSDGKLVITALESGGSYTSARIKTQAKKDFSFGRIDVRAKLPKGKGIWPAIWMLGSNITTAGWPACGEIDIMELVGHLPAQVHGTVHYFSEGYKSSTGSLLLSSGDFSDQFHVFTLLWDFNSIRWYVDNQHFKTFSRPSGQEYPFNNKFFFIMNVAVGGNWPGNPDDTTVFPQSMAVDYIRVFQ
jgi:beta-glucanase (GH16 family)